MIDPDTHELQALEDAGSMGGEYLESINKYDLSALSPEEYSTFISVVVGGFTDSLREQLSKVKSSASEIPL